MAKKIDILLQTIFQNTSLVSTLCSTHDRSYFVHIPHTGLAKKPLS